MNNHIYWTRYIPKQLSLIFPLIFHLTMNQYIYPVVEDENLHFHYNNYSNITIKLITFLDKLLSSNKNLSFLIFIFDFIIFIPYLTHILIDVIICSFFNSNKKYHNIVDNIFVQFYTILFFYIISMLGIYTCSHVHSLLQSTVF